MQKTILISLYFFFSLSKIGIPAEENSMQIYHDKQKNRQIINARSLSLEVAKHKHRLAAQLVSSFYAIFNQNNQFKIYNGNVILISFELL